MRADGVQWLRIDAPADNRFFPLMQAAEGAGINVDAIIEDWVTSDTPSAFTQLAQSVVTKLAPIGVHTYEVLNEINNTSMAASTYVPLLKAAYAEIHALDPQATVLDGADGVGSYAGEPVAYLTSMYAAGAQGYFDAANMHPYSYPDTSLDTQDSWNPWSYLGNLYTVMVQNGDGSKLIWLTEFGCPTGTDGGYPAACTDSTLAQQITDAYGSARSISFTGPLFVYDWIDDNTSYDGDFGLYYANGNPKAATLAAFEAADGSASPPPPPPPCTTYSSAATGSHQVCGAIRDKYEALGGPASFLGYPVTDEMGTPDGVGRYNHFANNGSIYWTPGTGAWSIHGAIRAKWASMGWERSVLGYPVTDERGTPDGVGRYNHFANSGSIYWTPSTWAWSIHGAIRAKWASMGWERSCLGYPVSDEFAISGGRQSNLQRGVITYAWATGQATSSC